MEHEPKKPVTVTREDLYKQVWETPMQRLADQYGISGDGLAKICDRLRVPYPPRGYWAKKTAGKSVRTLQLPQASPDTPADVLISPTPARLPPPPPPTMSAELQEKFNAALAQSSSITVPERLRRPHPVIAAWIDERARELAARRRGRFSEAFGLKPFTELEHRRHRILDTVFKEIERRGFKVRAERFEGVWLETGRERVDFSLYERIRQERRPLTPEQARDRIYSRQRWTQVKIPTGELAFKISTDLEPGMPTFWSDAPERLLEHCVGPILAVFSLAEPILQEKRRLTEERERKRRQEEFEQYKAAQLRRQENNRWRRFLELADRWHETDTVRRFVETLKELPPPEQLMHGERTHEEWLAWVQARLDEHDPLRHRVDGIWDMLADVSSWTYPDTH